MKKLYLFISIISIVSFLFVIVYSQFFTLPHTYLGVIDISGKSKQDLQKFLSNLSEREVKIRLHDRVYNYSYKQMGIILNINSIVQSAFQFNTFPRNFTSLFTTKTIRLPIIFTHDFDTFTNAAFSEYSKIQDDVYVDDTNKQLIYKKFVLDSDILRKVLSDTFATSPTITLPLKTNSSPIAQDAKDINALIEKIYSQPVTIAISDSSYTFLLTDNDLKKVTNIQYSLVNNQLQVEVSDAELQTILTPFVKAVASTNNKHVSLPLIKNDLLAVMNARKTKEVITPDTILTKLDDAPNTNGEIAQKYIEIDISQSKLYLFQDKKLVNSFGVSTGYYNPTPRGTFKILNKAPVGYSDIYNVWMPYWMAFYLDPKLNAYFGIHELPYYKDSKGNKYPRPASFIGSPHTGGCVALGFENSKTVYDFAEVGMPVVIYD